MEDHLREIANRWSLAHYLVTERNAPVIPLYPYNKGEGKAGKVPVIKEWQKRTSTTVEELEQWQKEDETYNIGLPLGNASGFVAIDVDGAEGKAILEELGKGNLPPTVRYNTPGGGCRYLYRIPEALRGEKLKKFSRRGEGEHCEVALMGDGQQTVLPFSVHPNGGVYRFVKGHRFKDIEVAEMPEWMISLMLPPKVGAVDANVQQGAPGDLASICSKCSRLETLCKEQEASGLDEETWFRVISFFSGIGRFDLAAQFSQRSSKHNARSEERINLLAREQKKMHVRCTTLGCTPQEIEKCQGPLRVGQDQEVVNSPAFVAIERPGGEEAGFYYDKDGRFRGVNCNLFVRSFLKTHRIRCLDGATYYHYAEDHWAPMKKHDLCMLMRRFFDLYEPDRWRTSHENEYWSVLGRLCANTETLTPADGYICVQNGLLNLATYELEPHTPDIFVTTKVPVEYAPEGKECPTFMKFLDEVFGGDRELINLTAEMFGYCMTNSTAAERAFILLGNGANGKSTLIDVLIAIVGEGNISTVALGDLGKSFARSQIVDKLLNISTEAELSNFNTESFKAIVSGDPMLFERKNENVFTTRPYCKIVGAVNRLPRTFDVSYGFARRLLILPFRASFVDEPICNGQKKIDRFMASKLMQELDGIFAFAIQGLKRLQANQFRFSIPEKMNVLLDEYVRSINPYVDFVRTCILVRADDVRVHVTNRRFVDAFMEFCLKNGWSRYTGYSYNKTLSELRNAMEMEGIPFSIKKSNGIRCLYGIELVLPGEWD